MDTGEKGKKCTANYCECQPVSYNTEQLQVQTKNPPNPNQKFARECDFEHFIFMYMTDLGKELELKGRGGEK